MICCFLHKHMGICPEINKDAVFIGARCFTSDISLEKQQIQIVCLLGYKVYLSKPPQSSTTILTQALTCFFSQVLISKLQFRIGIPFEVWVWDSCWGCVNDSVIPCMLLMHFLRHLRLKFRSI